jgi:membrane protein DedA with SNARE-associated domain
MIGTIIWLIGLILTIKAALEIWNTPGDTVKKLLFIILVLLTSWVGLVVYYFFAKDKIAGWVK